MRQHFHRSARSVRPSVLIEALEPRVLLTGLFGVTVDFPAAGGAPDIGQVFGNYDESGANASLFGSNTSGEFQLGAKGELVAAEGLTPPKEARIVRAGKGGKPSITDGPFAETKEFLAGFWIVECPTPDRAYEIAATLCEDWHRAGLWWGDERCVEPGCRQGPSPSGSTRSWRSSTSGASAPACPR